MGLSMNLLLDP